MPLDIIRQACRRHRRADFRREGEGGVRRVVTPDIDNNYRIVCFKAYLGAGGPSPGDSGDIAFASECRRGMQGRFLATRPETTAPGVMGILGRPFSILGIRKIINAPRHLTRAPRLHLFARSSFHDW